MLYHWPDRSRQGGKSYLLTSWLFVLGVVGSTAAVYGVTVPQARAQEQKNPYHNFKAGQVTNIQGADIQIDKTNYPLPSSVTITNQYEDPVNLKDLTRGDRVLFHLDHKGRIDRLVLWVPS